MKNYAGHRLSPWLGHLMVSRTETARALLTQGEIMQLPDTDEIVMLAGAHPVRAKKVRYYADPRLAGRVLAPPMTTRPIETGQTSDWADCLASSSGCDASEESMLIPDDDSAEGGIRREPEVPEHEDIVRTPQPFRNEFTFDQRSEDDEDTAARSRRLNRPMLDNARRAALDPKDGIYL
jgi:type IV secretion system protein VirD4